MANVQRTMFAAQAVGLADLFKTLIGPVRLNGPVVYRPELSAPEGESTGGGKQATQHVMLVPESGGATLVMGSLNVKEKTSELRQYLAFAQMIEQRFKGKVAVPDQESYEALLDKTQKFFASQSVRVSIIAPSAFASPDAAGGKPRPTRKSSRPPAAEEVDEPEATDDEDSVPRAGLAPGVKLAITIAVAVGVAIVALLVLRK